MAIDADGKIIAAGFGGAEAFNPHGSDVLFAKYDSKGNLDSSFGNNGLVIADFGLFEHVQCMQLLNNKKILVRGSCRADLEAKNNYFISRFNGDGSIDSSFGNKGIVVTDIGLSFGSSINSIAITDDESIIAAGKAEYLSSSVNDKFLLAKYTAHGKLITDFGINGLVFTNPGSGADFANAVALQSDGKIVVAGVTGATFLEHEAMCIIRYDKNGNLDKSFNSNGILVIYFGDDNAGAASLLIQPDGNFLLGGLKFPQPGTTGFKAYDFALASVTKDGSIDNSFGTQGILTTDFTGLQDACNAIALQPDGKIIAAGGSTDNSNNKVYFSLARYNNDDRNPKQIIISKIRLWLQHHNGIVWDNTIGANSYAVQRSANGVNFNTVATYTANNSSRVYYYQDPAPVSGDNYYRLQTTSTSGAVHYSNVIAVSNIDIKISPNPAKNSLHIEGLPSNKTTLTVVDFSGNIKMQTTAYSSSYNLNIAQLKAGNYLLKIEMNDDVVTRKFVKE